MSAIGNAILRAGRALELLDRLRYTRKLCCLKRRSFFLVSKKTEGTACPPEPAWYVPVDWRTLGKEHSTTHDCDCDDHSYLLRYGYEPLRKRMRRE
jgi:hypothetical protein